MKNITIPTDNNIFNQFIDVFSKAIIKSFNPFLISEMKKYYLSEDVLNEYLLSIIKLNKKIDTITSACKKQNSSLSKKELKLQLLRDIRKNYEPY
jgi:hypothetical protein